jgi:hypothetical protein
MENNGRTSKVPSQQIALRATARSQRLCGLWLGSPQPDGLKSVVDFCGVARSGKTAEGIAQHSRLQKISHCSSAAFMEFNQRFPRKFEALGNHPRRHPKNEESFVNGGYLW